MEAVVQLQNLDQIAHASIVIDAFIHFASNPTLNMLRVLVNTLEESMGWFPKHGHECQLDNIHNVVAECSTPRTLAQCSKAVIFEASKSRHLTPSLAICDLDHM